MLADISVSAQTGGRIAGVVIDDSGEIPLLGATLFREDWIRAKSLGKVVVIGKRCPQDT